MTDAIARAVLQDAGVTVTVLSWGATVQDWQVPLNGRPQRVVLGYEDPEAYRSDRFYIGAIVGRVANRIGGAAYQRRRPPVPRRARRAVAGQLEP